MTRNLIVLENPRRWNLDVHDAEIVRARDYLTNPRFHDLRGARVFNLCRTYGYQTVGYYVSLLADSRGHRPLPSVETLQDFRLSPVLKVASSDTRDLLQRTLRPLESSRFTLSIYFGRNLANRYDELARVLFNHFPAPFLRAEFSKSDEWRLEMLRPVGAGDVPEAHHDFVVAQADAYFAKKPRAATKRTARYDMAILRNLNETDAPSDNGGINRFLKASRAEGIAAEIIDKDDAGRIAEFDALFLRETTAVNHHTYRIARRAEAEGLVVIDDPTSIVRASNKVFLAEAFSCRKIAHPKTLIVDEDNADRIIETLGLPCVLKRPDSSFSRGVVKVEDQKELHEHLGRFFEDSELIIAQEWTPSEFDWRIGVLDGTPLWVCRYGMAPGHWQVIHVDDKGKRKYGRVQTLPVSQAPEKALDLAVRAARVVGDGLYGVDIKECDGKFLVMEVNDNPNLDSDVEDKVLGDDLYRAIMRHFYLRLERRGRGRM